MTNQVVLELNKLTTGKNLGKIGVAFIVDTYSRMVLRVLKKGTAKVGCRGVKVNSIYYDSDEFTKSDLETQVPVFYDPLNTGIVYCFVREQWVVAILREL
ncbi:MAG: Mu transposase C-terminal domain-containing protein [Desulfosporosinus sp.]|nr:Mu transposase C-terminal domain-containing protein [Desulfosporosinus sp.]